MTVDLEEKSYFKSIGTLVSGSLIGQIITFVCAPILTRLCSAHDLGVYALVTGAITIFGTITSLRYDVCIVSEKEEMKTYPLIKLSLCICACLSTLVTIGYVVYFSTRDTGSNFIILGCLTGLLVFLIGIINILNSFNNRKRNYKLITKAYTVRVALQNFGNLIAGYLAFGPIGLSASHLIGYSFGISGQAKPLMKRRKDINAVTIEQMKEVAFENKKQATLSAPAALANGLSYSLVNYFVEGLYSIATVGYYSLSFRILGLPITVIGGNISRVFLERAAREYNAVGNFRATYKSTIAILLATGIPMGVFLLIFAPDICEFVFGEGWGVAGVYIQLLTPSFILRYVAAGVNSSAIIVGKQHIDLGVQIALTICAIVVFAVSYFTGVGIEMFLGVLNVVFSAIYLLYIYLFWRCAKEN